MFGYVIISLQFRLCRCKSVYNNVFITCCKMGSFIVLSYNKSYYVIAMPSAVQLTFLVSMLSCLVLYTTQCVHYSHYLNTNNSLIKVFVSWILSRHPFPEQLQTTIDKMYGEINLIVCLRWCSIDNIVRVI